MGTVKRVLVGLPPIRFEAQALLCTAVLGVVGFVLLYPLFLLILNSFQVAGPDQGTGYGLDHWVRAVTAPG